MLSAPHSGVRIQPADRSRNKRWYYLSQAGPPWRQGGSNAIYLKSWVVNVTAIRLELKLVERFIAPKRCISLRLTFRCILWLSKKIKKNVLHFVLWFKLAFIDKIHSHEKIATTIWHVFFSFFFPYTYMDAQITKYKHYYLSRVINSLFRSDAQAFLFFSSCPDKSYLP